MSAIVYLIAAAMTLWLAQRVTRFSRAAAIIVLLMPLLFTGRALFTGGVLGPVDLAYTYEPVASLAQQAGVGAVLNPSISDVYSEFIPWNDSLRRSIAHHQWPLWDPFELCGLPLAGAAQSSPYHPITIIGLLVPLPQYFAFATSMMLFCAALSALMFLREIVQSEVAALFGAAAWMSSTHLVFFAGTALVLAVSITPFLLLGAGRIARAPSRHSVALLVIGLLLVVLAGHPESALHVVALSVVYFWFVSGWIPKRTSIGAGLTAGVLALLLGAIFLLPVIDTISQSEEYVHRATGYRQKSASIAQMRHRLSASFFPFLEGAPGIEEARHHRPTAHGWLATSYAGSMVFAPAIFALMRSRSRERWFFLAAFAFGIAISISAPGVTQIVGSLPGFRISVNDRMVVFATLGLCVLAAMGIDLIDAQMAKMFAAVAALILCIALFAPNGMTADYIETNAARAILPLVLAASAVLILPPRRACLALLALVLLQRAGEASSLQPTLPSRAFYPPFPGLDVMRGKEPFRIVGVGPVLPPETSTHYGLEDVRGFQATTFGRFHGALKLWSVVQPVWSNRVDRLDSPLLSLMNTKFAIVPAGVALPSWWMTRASFPGYAIAENTRVLPRAFVPRTVKTIIHPTDSMEEIAKIADFSEQSVIQDRLAHEYAPNGPGSVEIERYDRGRMRLAVHMQAAGWVVVSNAAWRGWHAELGDHRLPIRFANHTFLAFYAPAGDSEVRLFFRPPSFVIGAWISGVTALLALAYALIPSSAITFFMSFQTSFFALGVRRRYAG